MTRVVLLVLFAEIWNTIGHILFKKSANSMKSHNLRDFGGYIILLKNIVTNRAIWLALGAMFIGMIIWFTALAGADLSVVSPMGSIQYVIILIAAHFLLNEKINPLKVAGTLLVVLGITLLALS